MGIKGKMWTVVNSLYVNHRSCIFSEGKSSERFPVKQAVAQGCTFLPTLFLIYIRWHLHDNIFDENARNSFFAKQRFGASTLLQKNARLTREVCVMIIAST